MALPGIGRSTAGAILALAHRPAPADPRRQRQARAVARRSRVRGAAGIRGGPARLWALAEACTPRSRVAEYTQAIMDLGATICTRAQSRLRPLSARRRLRARLRQGLCRALPARAQARAAARCERTQWSSCCMTAACCCERRPPRGIWGGLWAPPEFPEAAAAAAWWQSRFGATAAKGRRLPVAAPCIHAFRSRHRAVGDRTAAARCGVAEADARLAGTRAATNAVGLPAPVARLTEGGCRDGPRWCNA